MKAGFVIPDHGDWWRQVMTEQEHDELERAFADIMAEHESERDVIEVSFEIIRGELVDLLVELTAEVDEREYDGVVGRVLTMIGGALASRYMEHDIAVDERANRAWHYWMENDPVPEDWDEDDDVDFGEDDCS